MLMLIQETWWSIRTTITD